MSAYLYGRLTRLAVDQVENYKVNKGKPGVLAPQDTEGEGIAKAIAALIPSDVLTVHALALSFWTTTDATGETSITDEGWLRLAFGACLALTVVLVVFGRGNKAWTWLDGLRVLIPVIAFVFWTALLGTSALTPWLIRLGYGSTPHTALVFVATVGAVLVLAVNAALNPKKHLS